jgi:hypothetical protein
MYFKTCFYEPVIKSGLPVPNERQQHINIKQLRLLMPKCDEHELNQTWEFLLTSQQIDEAVNDGRPGKSEDR